MPQNEEIAKSSPKEEMPRRRHWEAPTIEAAPIDSHTFKNPSVIEDNGLFSKSVS